MAESVANALQSVDANQNVILNCIVYCKNILTAWNM